jgi:hypothetical protein
VILKTLDTHSTESCECKILEDTNVVIDVHTGYNEMVLELSLTGMKPVYPIKAHWMLSMLQTTE